MDVLLYLLFCYFVYLFMSNTRYISQFSFFFFIDATTLQIYTLSLHDALPISAKKRLPWLITLLFLGLFTASLIGQFEDTDRKSTRLNSSHVAISYAVFCLKKKN